MSSLRFIAALGLLAFALASPDVAGQQAQPMSGGSAPKWELVPRTTASVPLGTVVLDSAALSRAPKANAVPLDRYGYVEEEYFLSGKANLYAADATKNDLVAYGFGAGSTVATPDVPYTTRILVRRPADANKFSGTVQLEAIGDGDQRTTIWGWSWPYLVANGDTWVGITVSKDDVAGAFKKYNASRYARLDLKDNGLRWDILAQIAGLMRGSEGPLGKLGFLDHANKLQGLVKVYSTGWGMGGCIQTEFINKSHHAQARTSDGRPLINGYVVGGCVQGDPVVVPKDAPVIQVMTESEYQVGSNPIIAARFPDGNEPTKNRARWYDIAGASHFENIDDPQLQLAAFQLGQGGGAATSCASPLSELPGNGDFMRGILAQLDKWARTGMYPPPGKTFTLNDDHTIKRDDNGNAVGGVRPYWVEVPAATFVAATADRPGAAADKNGQSFCRQAGHVEPFAKDKFAKLYKDHDEYVEKVAEYLDKLVAGNVLLFQDAKSELDQLRGDGGKIRQSRADN